MLRGKLYLGRKKEQGGDHGQRLAAKEKPKAQNELLESTAATIAKETGVSRETVKRDAKFAAEAEKQGVTKDVMAGKVKKREVMAKVAKPVPAKPKPAPPPEVEDNRPLMQSIVIEDDIPATVEKTE